MKKLIVGLTVGMMLGSAATAFAAEDIGKEIKAVFAKVQFQNQRRGHCIGDDSAGV